MMHSSGRDSGYCENGGPESCENSSESIASPNISPFFQSPAKTMVTTITPCRGAAAAATTAITRSPDLIEKYDTGADSEGDVHLLLSPDCRITGSSCRALKHAVSNLTRLDDFICVKIGDGFFSEVFKVTHRVTGRVMVLKMNLLRSNRANMLKEVQLMNRLSHPNILKFMGVCVHEGQLHALTEYINGGSLEQLIQSSQELAHSMRIKIALDIAKGMQYLHSQDVFHRDLTSKNVLIKKSEDCKEMTAVVGDFGLAAKIPRPGVRLPTVGSPWWMSPECLKGQWYDERSDIFSYGIVLCELIARVDADPDVLPRTSNFGLDYLAFVEICSQLSKPPPPKFLKLAFSCCNLEPKNRPSFSDLIKILEKIENSASNGGTRYPVNGYLTEAKSEELLPCPSPSAVLPSETKNNHIKQHHRRSLSEDIGLIVFPSVTAPSEKARCHLMSHQNGLLPPPLKFVAENMYHEDPHYVPNDGKSNPFASLSKFRGVKKVLGQTNSTDLFSSCFELPSPFYGTDERNKRLFYSTDTASTSINSKTRSAGVGAAIKLPYIVESSCGGNDISARGNGSGCKSSHRSSIIIEPVVKPSEIKKYSSNGYKFKSSFGNASRVTKSQEDTSVASDEDCEQSWQQSRDSLPSVCSSSTSTSTSSSSSCSTTSCNTTSVTLRLNEESKSKGKRSANRCDKCKPSSLPSSPTFSRRRASLASRFSLCKTDNVEDDIQAMDAHAAANTTHEKKLSSPPLVSHIYSHSHPLCKSRSCTTDIQLLPDSTTSYGKLLRSCSSSSNLNALEECSNIDMVYLPVTETPTLNLRRRGSCESGFYSIVGEDFCVPGIDVCVGHHHHYTASSVTLSSSSAASSLFLDSNSEENSTPVFFNGRYPYTLHHQHHHPHHHHHHYTSSVYTDSSEDVSSLASSETPTWDDRQKPQHISKIVEYFERKQTTGGNSALNHKLDFLESSNRITNLHASIRRNWIQNDGGQTTRPSLDYYTRRKLFEKPLTGGSHVMSKRSANQRLLVCEGAVKSKLPIFDKK